MARYAGHNRIRTVQGCFGDRTLERLVVQREVFPDFKQILDVGGFSAPPRRNKALSQMHDDSVRLQASIDLQRQVFSAQQDYPLCAKDGRMQADASAATALASAPCRGAKV
jgi:hypothetical protein